MNLTDYTLALLDDIERRIDPETEEDYYSQWENFWNDTDAKAIFRPKRKKTSSSGIEIKNININDALTDFELMLDLELANLSKKIANESTALGIRANYGTGIISSMFGAEIFRMPRHTNTLPTTKSFNDSDKMRELLEKGVPDFYSGFGKDVLFFGERCAEIFERYPNIKKYVQIYHPDTQGTLDLAELMWGGEMFYEMYDDPDFVHDVLKLITNTYKGFLDKWYEVIPKYEGLSVHWELMHKGNILIRLDSAMNIPVEFYDEFSKPYDKELLEYFDGGCMHFCGRGDHYVGSMCDIEKMYGFNMSQPHLNDLSKIFGAAMDNNKKILRMPRADEFVTDDNVRKGIVHGKEPESSYVR